LFERRTHMKRSLWITVITLVLCLLFAGNVTAGQVLNRIGERGELIVGTSGTQPPLSFKSVSGKIMGLDMDMAEMMAAAMEVKLRKTQMPFKSLLPALKAGKVDVVISGMTMVPKRNMGAAFIGPYHISGKGVLTKEKNVQLMQDPEKINRPDFKLAVLQGSTSQMIAEEVLPKAKLIPTKTLELALDMLIKDQADAIIADFPTCSVLAFRHQEEHLAVGQAQLSFEPLGIAVAEGDPLLVNWMENYLNFLRVTGQLKTLKKKWFEPGPWVKEIP
jgi:polar amino acid transport system substrate-binding protein